jgi:hypothetical protein
MLCYELSHAAPLYFHNFCVLLLFVVRVTYKIYRAWRSSYKAWDHSQFCCRLVFFYCLYIYKSCLNNKNLVRKNIKKHTTAQKISKNIIRYKNKDVIKSCKKVAKSCKQIVKASNCWPKKWSFKLSMGQK